jgi:hypothetical protein
MSDINEKLSKKANEMMKQKNDNDAKQEGRNEIDQILDDIKSENDATSKDGTLDYAKLNELNASEIDPADADKIITEQFGSNDNTDETEVKEEAKPEPKKESVSERAKKYREKNSIITLHEKEDDGNKNSGVGDELFDTGEIDKENEEISARLAQYAAEDASGITDKNADKAVEVTDIYESNSIDDLISEMNETTSQKENEVDPEDLSTLLAKVEENKLYSTIADSEEITGPAQYIVEQNDDYVDAIDDILDSNNINFIKASKKKKNAILDRFTNSGAQVTVPLVNSGIFIKGTGAGTTEVISMFSTSGNNVVREELNKLQHVVQHIVGSSIGRMELRQLIKVVSYYDKDTLFYMLFAGTYPDEVELSRRCSRCGTDFYIKTKTTNLLLNPEDFEKETDDIRNNVTTYNRLLETSKLGKTYRKVHSNGLVIYYKHPSIDSYLTTLQVLTKASIDKYPDLADAAYCIDKILIHEKDNNFIEITDPNEILDFIGTFKDVDEKYEIFDMIDSVRENTIPVFGFKECNCPNCGFKNPNQPFAIEDLLFTVAQQREDLASLKWAARMQKMKSSKKKSKDTKN